MRSKSGGAGRSKGGGRSNKHGSERVGFGMPPASGQFKRGHSGNPKGRPKGSRNLKTIIQSELNSLINVTANGIEKRMTRKEAMAKGLVNDALSGKDRPRDRVIAMAEQFDEMADQHEANDLAAEDEAILKRFTARIRSEIRVELATENTEDENGGVRDEE